MSTFKLLSRGTNLRKGATKSKPQAAARNDVLPIQNAEPSSPSAKRRKLDLSPSTNQDSVAALDFFAEIPSVEEQNIDITEPLQSVKAGNYAHVDEHLTIDERRALFKKHKIKVTVLSVPVTNAESESGTSKSKSKKKKHRTEEVAPKDPRKTQLFPQPVTRFESLSHRFDTPESIIRYLRSQGFTDPTDVQLVSLPLLLSSYNEIAESGHKTSKDGIDLLAVAPTGSGKTLAFLVPLMQRLLQESEPAKGPRAIVLAPTKELVAQIANEGRKMGVYTGIKVETLQKGSHLFSPSSEDAVSSADIVVTTPLALLNAITDKEGTVQTLPQIQHLILDEGDVLLDTLFRDQTLATWQACRHPDLHISLWSATMSSTIESLVSSTLVARPTRHSHALIRLVIGLKDTALPSISHRLLYTASEHGKLTTLRQLLHPSTTSTNLPTIHHPILVFVQTIPRAIALHAELRYDIPTEAGGSTRIAALHADLTPAAREDVLTRFRKGEVWVLITTDLLARGLNFRGVRAVVNYDIPTSAAAYVHRVGRTGRRDAHHLTATSTSSSDPGNEVEGGKDTAVTLYTKDDIPHLKSIANVISASEGLRSTTPHSAEGGRGGSSDVQPWLLSALPTQSKNAKKELKKRGVETRRPSALAAKGGTGRISTKSGFERRMESRKRSRRSGGGRM